MIPDTEFEQQCRYMVQFLADLRRHRHRGPVILHLDQGLVKTTEVTLKHKITVDSAHETADSRV